MQTSHLQAPRSGHTIRQAALAHNAPAQSARPAPDLSAANASPTKILLSDPEGAAVYGVGLRTFLELQLEPWFPKPVMLGPRLKRHIRGELEAAVLNMPRPERPAEPSQLLRGKIEKMKRAGVPA